LGAATEGSRLRRVHWVSKPDAGLPALGEGGAGVLANQPSLLLGEGGVEVEHEWVRIDTEFGDNERHPLCHQPGDEGYVTGQPVELCDDHRTALTAGGREGAGELRPPLERVGALAGCRLHELGGDGESSHLGKVGDGRLLRLNAQAGAALPLGRDPVVGDGGRHRRAPSLFVQTAYHRLPFVRSEVTDVAGQIAAT
jgi:hypothetical protein